MSEEQPEQLAENSSDSDLDSDSEDSDEYCENTDSEEEDPIRRVQPDALDSVSSTSINRYFHHCKQVIEAYEAGEVYGTKEFADRGVQEPSASC